MRLRSTAVPKLCHAGLLAAVTLTCAALGFAPAEDSTAGANVPVRPDARAADVTRGPRPSTIRVDVDLTLVPVSVTDLWDRPFKGLLKDDFQLFENGIEQQIISLTSEDAPVSVGVVFDTSRSMRKELGNSLAALEELFKTTMPGDEFFAVSFADRPHLVSGFTGDAGEILRSLGAVQAHGWTALYDAIQMAVQQMRSARNSRRALLILSDGADNYSRYTASEVRDMVRESDVRIYAIGLFERPGFLKKISEETGGRALWVRKREDLPQAISALSTELRSYYLLGYKSSNAQRDGKYRSVKVKVTRDTGTIELHTTWRRGYYAPAE
jgi:VWFA-related protein